MGLRGLTVGAKICTGATLLSLLVLLGGCGGGSGGSGGTKGGGGGGGGGVGPLDRASVVASLVKKVIPDQKAKVFFHEHADGVRQALATQLTSGLHSLYNDIARDAGAPLERAQPSRVTRHGDTGRPGPVPDSWEGPHSVHLDPIAVGPFTVNLDGSAEKYHEKNRIGFRLHVNPTVAGTLIGITVHAAMKVDDDFNIEYCPSTRGIVEGDAHATVGFTATISDPGAHSMDVGFDLVKSSKDHITDEAELGTVDSMLQSSYHPAFDGDRQDGHLEGSITGTSIHGDGNPQLGDVKLNIPPNTPPDEASSLKDTLVLIYALMSIQEDSARREARAIWQGGFCVEAQHVNADVPIRVKPGQIIPLDFLTHHKIDGSTVTAHYESNLEAPTVQQPSPGHFIFTVPQKGSPEAQTLADSGLIIKSVSNRGIGQNIHRYVLDFKITTVVPDESNGTLVLFGSFGTKPGTVKVGGTSLAVQSWTDEKIVCTLPLTGNGSSGTTTVEFDDAKSNAVELTEWSGQFLYTWQDVGTLKHSMAMNVRIRADIGSIRAGRIPLDSTINFAATKDSSAHYTSGGDFKTTIDPCTYKVNFSQVTGDIPVFVNDKTRQFGCNGTFDKTGQTMKMTLFATSFKAYTISTEQICPGVDQTDTHALDLSAHVPTKTPGPVFLTLSLDKDNVIQPGTLTQQLASITGLPPGTATETLEWQAIAPGHTSAQASRSAPAKGQH